MHTCPIEKALSIVHGLLVICPKNVNDYLTSSMRWCLVCFHGDLLDSAPY